MNIQCLRKGLTKQNYIDGYLLIRDLNLAMEHTSNVKNDLSYQRHYQIGNGRKIPNKNGWINIIN